MMYRSRRWLLLLWAILGLYSSGIAQINVNHVISIGRNALYFNDYVVSIGCFNQVIDTRPWLAEPYLYRAIAKVSLDDYVGAERDAAKSIELNPYISRSYLVRGVALQNLNHLDEAIEVYERGLSLSPDNGQMRFNKAVAELKTKRLEGASRSVDSLLYYNPRYNEAYPLKASIALEQRDTTAALLHIEEALRLDPSQVIAYKLRASVAANRNDWYVGIDDISRALELTNNREADLFAQRAIMRYQVNNLRGAMQDYSQAIDIDPRHTIALHNRALLRQQVGEKSLALEDWTRYLAIDSSNYNARYNRALLSSELGTNYVQALNDMNAVLTQYPSFVDGYIQRAALRFKMGDKRGADFDYWQANELINNRKANQSALAKARNNNKKETKQESDRAIDKYAMLIEEIPTSAPDARYSSRERGRVQDRYVSVEQRPMFYLSFYAPVDSTQLPMNLQTYYSQLIDDYNKYADGYPLRIQSTPHALSVEQIAELNQMLSDTERKGDVYYYLRRGVIHSLLQDYEQAILDYNKVLSLDARNELALWARSIASMRYTEAQAKGVREGEQAKNSGNLVGKPNRSSGSTNSVIGIIPNALQDLGQLQMINPNFAYAYYNRAVLYAGAGERLSAITDYSRAIELEPRLAEAYYNRGLLLLSEGKVQEGIQDLSKAGELGLYEAYSIIKRMQ